MLDVECEARRSQEQSEGEDWLKVEGYEEVKKNC